MFKHLCARTALDGMGKAKGGKSAPSSSAKAAQYLAANASYEGTAYASISVMSLPYALLAARNVS